MTILREIWELSEKKLSFQYFYLNSEVICISTIENERIRQTVDAYLVIFWRQRQKQKRNKEFNGNRQKKKRVAVA